MSEELKFTFKKKKSSKLSNKINLPENDSNSTVIVEEDTKSLASESVSSTHSYEQYAEAYNSFQREEKISNVNFDLEEEDDEQGQDIRKKSKLLKQTVREEKKEEQNDKDLVYKIAQLSLRIDKMESESKMKTLDSAFNTVMANVENLSTAQKKSMVTAILSTMT
nr:NSP5 [Bat RVJ-like rotavirus BtSY1]